MGEVLYSISVLGGRVGKGTSWFLISEEDFTELYPLNKQGNIEEQSGHSTLSYPLGRN